MCTVSVSRSRNGVVITMNRDERRSRPEAGVMRMGSMAYPVDGKAKGTWCGFNKDGLAATLLNRYEDGTTTAGAKSRGELIPQALQYSTIEQAIDAVKQLWLQDYNPFSLRLSSLTETHILNWNGLMLTEQQPPSLAHEFASSSSLEPEDIPKVRQKRFESWLRTSDSRAEGVPKIHLDREHWDSSTAIFMDREYTHTKSITQFTLGQKRLSMHYYDETSLQKIRSCPRGVLRLTEAVHFSRT
ncbi:MAG: NRDE family protein [Gammaproteobacteria bacterium]|nr:NRDE family protein [Gammaproteobacteria bacterium]